MICTRCGAPNHDGSVLCRGCAQPLGTVSPDLTSQPTGPVDGLRDVPVVFAPGQPLGERYTVVERIGAGGMGMVYKALDRRLGKTVALKLIQAKAAARPAAQERFRRELSLAQQVSHPNVCRVHDLGEVDGTTFISMEYVEGQTLEVLIHSMGHLSPSQTVALGRQICAGLQAIHERGIIHRDLKPGNVMVDRLGHVLLVDFGMAYQKDQDRLTAEGAIFGTLAYLSPEQGRGLADFRSDVYALGLILYEMLTGKRPPGDDGPLPLALRAPEEVCPAPSHFSPEVPGALDTLVMRCLERTAEKRFASADELSAALDSLGDTLTQTATMHLASLPRPAAPRTRWRTPALLALAALVAGAGTWFVARRLPQPAIVVPAGVPISIALLPFSYDGPEDSAYLKDLLPLAMSADLGRTAGIQVTPFASAREFGPREDAAAVARQLAVVCLVRGRLTARAGQAEGTLQLVRADGSPVLTRRLHGSLTELVQATDELSAELARALGVRSVDAPSRSPAALQAYLEGLAALEGWDVKANASSAQAAFTRALAAQPDFAEAHAGRALAQLNEYNASRQEELIERAAADARRALELAATLPESHVALGLVHLWRGQSAQATAAFERAAALAPADDAIFRRIGVAYSRNNRPDEADKMFARAIKLRPGFWDNYNDAGSHFLQTGRAGQAGQMYRKVIELHPESDVGYGNLGAALLLEGRFLEAEPLLVSALRIKPTSALHTNLGFTYSVLGRYEAALDQYRKALSMETPRPESLGNLGDALRHLGRVAEARTAYRKAVDLLEAQLRTTPSDPDLRAKAAMFLAASGQCATARREIRRLGPAPRDDLSYYLALAHAVCGDTEQAVAFSLKALDRGLAIDLRTNPDLRQVQQDPRIRRRLAQIDQGTPE